MKDTEKDKPVKKGPVIPAGTEQETGLTRGQTEKPGIRKPGKHLRVTRIKKGK